MAVLTAAEAEAFGRILYADTDASDPALTSSEWQKIHNEKYLRWHEKVEPRYQIVTTGSSGFTLAGSASTVVGSLTTLAEIGQVLWYAGAGTAGTEGVPLEILPLSDFFRRRGVDTSAAGPPAIGSLTRENTDTEADIGKWRLRVWPNADATYQFPVMVRKVPVALAAGGTDQPDVSEPASYTIARLAAADAAYIVGEDSEFIANILRPVSQDVLASMGMTELALRPHASPHGRAT